MPVDGRIVRLLLETRLLRCQNGRDGGYWIRLAMLARRCPAIQHFGERTAEICITKWIKDRVEGGIDVAQPQCDFEESVDNAVGTDGHYEEDDEIRQPAHDESAHDDAQLPGSLSFLLRDEHRRSATTTTTTQCRTAGFQRAANRWMSRHFFTSMTIVALLLVVVADVFHFNSDVDVMGRTLFGAVHSAIGSVQFQ